MANLLVRQQSVVLQDVVVGCPHGQRKLLCNGKEFGEFVVGDIVQLLAVRFRNHQLASCEQQCFDVASLGDVGMCGGAYGMALGKWLDI